MASYDTILAPIPIQVRGRSSDDSPWILFSSGEQNPDPGFSVCEQSGVSLVVVTF